MRAVLFDMDGVVVDSERHWKSVEPEFLKALAPGWKDKHYARLIGCSIQDIHALLVKESGLEMPWEDFIASYGRIADGIYGKKAALVDGCRELLEALRAEGLPAGLASSSPRRWIELVLDRFGLRPLFRAVVSADELGGEGKPSPAIYLRAAAALGVRPQDCVAIEDSRNGLLSAQGAGMLCVGFRDALSHAQDLSGADLVVESLRDLSPARLKSMFERPETPLRRIR